jgi:uncharacterized protein YlzI (FlbEa/FlbD family)
VILSVVLLLLQTLDGRSVLVNPKHIVTLTTSRDESDPRKRLTAKVHCVIHLSDGKFISVTEDCTSVQQRLAKDAAPLN